MRRIFGWFAVQESASIEIKIVAQNTASIEGRRACDGYLVFGGDRRGEFSPATTSEVVGSGSRSGRQEELGAARGVEPSSFPTSTT